MRYCKYTESGDFYMMLDGRGEDMSELTTAAAISLMCDEFSTERVFVIYDSKKGDFRVDGYDSEGKLLFGAFDGLRCAVSFASALGFKPSSEDGYYIIESASGMIRASIVSTEGSLDEVSIKLPEFSKAKYIEELSEAPVDGWEVKSPDSTFVIFDEDIEDINVTGAGQIISNCSEFAPEGTDVCFACPYAGGLKLRIYDSKRGREKFILSSSVAASVAAFKEGIIPQEGEDGLVECKLWLRGSRCKVVFSPGDKFSDIRFLGTASFVMCT